MIKNRKGFTLIELLVVIAIIGLLSTLSVVALNSAREKARNARRVSDVKQVQTALELYMNDLGSYPTTGAVVFATTASIVGGGKTYMASVPSNPIPMNDGNCPNSNYEYSRQGVTTYTITYCLSEATGGIAAGTRYATPAGIDD